MGFFHARFLCRQVRPAGPRELVFTHQTAGRLLLLRQWSARAPARPRQLLRPDGLGHDRRHHVSAVRTNDVLVDCPLPRFLLDPIVFYLEKI